MENHTRCSPGSWKMHEVIPYLLKYYFNNQATSKEDLMDAFWKLMGKNIADSTGKQRWTDNPQGVPSQTDKQLLNKGIIGKDRNKNYFLEKKAERIIKKFERDYSKTLIDEEIAKYVGKQSDLDASG